MFGVDTTEHRLRQELASPSSIFLSIPNLHPQRRLQVRVQRGRPEVLAQLGLLLRVLVFFLLFGVSNGPDLDTDRSELSRTSIEKTRASLVIRSASTN